MSPRPETVPRQQADLRREVVAHCQWLVDTGSAQWHVNDDGQAELHLSSGEAYLLGDLGVTRLR